MLLLSREVKKYVIVVYHAKDGKVGAPCRAAAAAPTARAAAAAGGRGGAAGADRGPPPARPLTR
jgi:hypothetical protein